MLDVVELDDEPFSPDDEPFSSLDDVSDDDGVELFSPVSSEAFLLPVDDDRRSFLAHPEPLNTMVGGAKAFRIGPEPHSGHESGAGSLTPWMTSKRRPHAAQV